MRAMLGWCLAALLTMIITTATTLPAAWLAPLVERQTGGRLSLGDVTGSVWRGSAFVGAISTTETSASPLFPDIPLVPLLPGRFHWQLSPMVLLGRLEMRLDNPDALSQSAKIRGSGSRWQLTPSALLLPADRLTALGAPLNTLKPSGRMRLSWDALTLTRSMQGLTIDGHMQLDLTEIASALSPVKPLGAYQLQVDWRGDRAQLKLQTLSGPLQLQGGGVIVHGRLQFSGQAWAEEGQEQRLAVLLNLLGQRRQSGNRNIIALEFK